MSHNVKPPRKGSQAEADWQYVNIAPTPTAPASPAWERYVVRVERLISARAKRTLQLRIQAVLWDPSDQEWGIVTEHTTSIIYRAHGRVSSRPLTDTVTWYLKPPVGGVTMLDAVDHLLEEIAEYEYACQMARRRATKIETMVEQIADAATAPDVRKALEAALDAELPEAKS